MQLRWIGCCVAVLAACPKRDDDAKRAPHEAPATATIVIPPAVLPPFDLPAPADKVIDVGRWPTEVCAVRESGAVDCWGESGPLHRVPGVGDAVAIDTNARCVKRRTGEVACLTSDRRTFEPVPKLAHVVDVGWYCHRIEGGRIACGEGALIPNVRDAIALAHDGDTDCAITKQGTVFCALFMGGPWALVHDLEHVEDVVVARSLAGNLYGCAASSGTTSCFSINEDHGTLQVVSPREVPQLARARQLSIYAQPYIAVTEGVVDGKVVRVEERDTITATTLPNLTDAAVHVRGCAVRTTGALVCWGSNRYGELAQPTTLGTKLPPTPVPGLRDITSLSLGRNMGFALTRAGQVFRWGSRTDIARTRPEEVSLPGVAAIEQVAATPADQLCVRASGRVWCELRVRNDPRWQELRDLGVTGVQALAIADGELYTTYADGHVENWALLLDTYDDKPSRVPVVAVPKRAPAVHAGLPSGAVDVELSAGVAEDATQKRPAGETGCAIMRDHTVMCWGANYFGEVPDGSLVETTTPIGIALP